MGSPNEGDSVPGFLLLMGHAAQLAESGKDFFSLQIARIENALLKTAMPGVYGSVRIDFSVRSIGSEDEVSISRQIVHKVGVRTEQKRPVTSIVNRSQKVKNALREIKEQLRINEACKAIVVHFADGVVTQFHTEDTL